MRDDINTKAELSNMLSDTIRQTNILIQQFPQIDLYKNILQQLEYIKSIVIDQHRKPTDKESRPVTLGSIAIKNFEYQTDPYAENLMDIYSGFIHYDELV